MFYALHPRQASDVMSHALMMLHLLLLLLPGGAPQVFWQC
jgi:hypothetical protein